MFRRIAIAFVAAVALALTPATADAYLYWADNGAPAIMRTPSDGSGIAQPVVSGTPGTNGVAVAGPYLYWSNGPGAAIGRADLNGANPNSSFITGASGPFMVAADDQYVYWSNQGSGTIGRANLDGTGANQSFITGLSGISGIAVDAGHIYWANFGMDAIGRANLDGSGVTPFFIIGAFNPGFVAVTSEHIYWSNYASGAIGRANLDGTGVNQSFITGASNPIGVAADAEYVYWANTFGATIGRAGLDGGNVDQSFISGANAQGLAVTQPPVASATPSALTFGTPTPVPQGSLSAPQTVTYTNAGTAPLEIRGFSFSGANPDDFLTTGDTCRFAIDPGRSCTVQVRFAPQAQGSRAGLMTAETNAAADPQTTLSGTAGPLPSGPPGAPGTPGTPGTPGAPGAPGRDAEVTCTVVKKKGGHRKGGKKIKVTCTVVLTTPATGSVAWRLASGGETVAQGSAAISGGRARIGRRDFGELDRGRYTLRVDGRRAARFVVR